MSRGNDFDPLINDSGEFKIDHLKDLSLDIDIEFDNGDTRTIKVHMRPTNHLFSRSVDDQDWCNRPSLEKSGYWLTSYIHHEGNYQQVKHNPPKVKEHRIFCHEKWSDSFFFPDFFQILSQQPAQTTVLANEGDSKTCLSGILEIENRPTDVYLVFFTINKINSKEVNMLIESAYCVSKEEHVKAKRLLSSKRDNKKPFIIVLKNILEGRLPLESKKKSGRSYKIKKKKK